MINKLRRFLRATYYGLKQSFYVWRNYRKIKRIHDELIAETDDMVFLNRILALPSEEISSITWDFGEDFLTKYGQVRSRNKEYIVEHCRRAREDHGI